LLLRYIPKILLANLIGPNSITQPAATLKPGRSHCFIPLISLLFFTLLPVLRTKGNLSSERACTCTHAHMHACGAARARSYGLGNQAQSIGNVKNHFFYLIALCSPLLLFPAHSYVPLFASLSFSWIHLSIESPARFLFLSVFVGVSSMDLSNRPQSRIQPLYYDGFVINGPSDK